MERGTRYVQRGLIYLSGLFCLAFGLMLCTKTGLGATAVISFPYAVAHASGWPLTAVLFANYIVMIALQLAIKQGGLSMRELAQLPLCALNSVLIGWLGELFSLEFASLWQNLCLLLAAIILVGAGGAMMVGMKIAPQPPEGLCEVISGRLGKDLGFGKNVVDFSCVALAALTDLLLGGGKLSSVGLGTVLAMILTGRVIFVFNRFFAAPMGRFAGLTDIPGRAEEPSSKSSGTSNKEEKG